jgi:hypothetical protein
VDLKPARIDVARSVVATVGGIAEKSTTTNRSRHIAVDPIGVDLLRAQLDDATSAVRDAGIELPGDSYVFSMRPGRFKQTDAPISRRESPNLRNTVSVPVEASCTKS